jgi:hypothetical protein
MIHGEQTNNQSTSSFEIVDNPENGGEPSQVAVMNDSPDATQEAKTRVFEGVERQMEAFRKGECSRFQASTRVAKELEGWEGASDKEKGKAYDSYLAEINSIIAIQDEDRSATKGTSPSLGTTHLTGGQKVDKRVRDEVEELLDQVSREGLDEEDNEQRFVRKRAKEEEMPWYDPSSNSSRRTSCVETCRTLRQFNEDLSGVKSLLRVAHNLPEGIPSSQWDRIIRGESVDLNQVLVRATAARLGQD